MSHSVVYYRLISSSGLNVLAATENLGNKELYLRVDNLGYRKGVWKTNISMKCTWNQTVNCVMTVNYKYVYFWTIYMKRTWTEQIKPVWVNSKVRLKHVVAMLSPTPWGAPFQVFISRGFQIMVVSSFSTTLQVVMVDRRGPLASVALWTSVSSPVLKGMVKWVSRTWSVHEICFNFRCRHGTMTFPPPQYVHCNTSEDIQQLCWLSLLMTCRRYIQWYIYYFKFNHDWCLAPHRRGFDITHSDAPQSVGFLWTSGRLVAETSTWQHTTLTTDRHPRPRWDSNPHSQQS
jgi:hypothetical protein